MILSRLVPVETRYYVDDPESDVDLVDLDLDHDVNVISETDSHKNPQSFYFFIF